MAGRAVPTVPELLRIRQRSSSSSTESSLRRANAPHQPVAMSLLGMGNPLLDISAVVPAEMLTKYGVKPNDAVLAGAANGGTDEQLKVYEDMVSNFEVQYIAGGATQNSIRVAQWLAQAAGTTSYIGCIGKDDYGEQLKAAAAKDGVETHYLEDESTPTGKCAVLVTADGERSLITDLQAANNYKIEHFNEEEQQKALSAAKVVYSSGFFMTVCPDAMLAAAKHCNANGKTYCLNLAAPFLIEVPPFWAVLESLLPYADYVFGNESEFETFAKKMEWDPSNMNETVAKLQALPKEGKPRTAIVTQGSLPALIATADGVTEHPVIKCDNVVDTNGAGDAWVGGYLFGLATGKETAESVKAANYAANHIIQRSGCTMAEKPEEY